MKKLKNRIALVGLRQIKWISRKLHFSLFDIGLGESGIGHAVSLDESGEANFIRNILPGYLQGKKQKTFLDIGTNIGEYALELQHAYPEATIHCFEPNPVTYQYLVNKNELKATIHNLGLSDQEDTLTLYVDSTDDMSVQASLNIDIVQQIGNKQDITEHTVKISTLKLFCEKENISQIDFMKIDTEGFELEVLNGGIDLLTTGKIHVIQFEFNEVNIVKRRFLKDFYDLMPNYDFYRIDKLKLIPLGAWNAKNEIFLFQNIVAVLKK